jgi:hypothetical protein
MALKHLCSSYPQQLPVAPHLSIDNIQAIATSFVMMQANAVSTAQLNADDSSLFISKALPILYATNSPILYTFFLFITD